MIWLYIFCIHIPVGVFSWAWAHYSFDLEFGFKTCESICRTQGLAVALPLSVLIGPLALISTLLTFWISGVKPHVGLRFYKRPLAIQ